MPSSTRWTCCLTLLALAACAAPPDASPGASGTKRALPVSTAVASASLAGLVSAPAGMTASATSQLISQDGGSIISQDGGSIISQDGGSLKQRGLLAIATRPLAGATVQAVDASHKVVARATTDAKGRYELKGLPKGVCLVQVSVKTANGQPGVLATLADAARATSADVDLATTLMAVRVVQAKPLGAVDVEGFAANVAAIAGKLTAVPDVAHPKAMAQQADDITASMPSQTPAASPTPTPAPTLVTLAGTGTAGKADGPGLQAGFDTPGALAVVGRYLYVADDGNRLLRKIDLEDATAPVATVPASVPLGYPLGLAAGQDTLYAAGQGVFKLTPDGQATRLANADGEQRAVTATAGGNVLLADPSRHRLYMLGVADVALGTLSVAGTGAPGGTNGTGADTSLNRPQALALTGKDAYVACAGDGRIVLAQDTGGDMAPRHTSTYATGFQDPRALAIVPGTGLVVADAAQDRVAVASDGRTLAGQLGHPGGLAWDANHRRLYVADTSRHAIRYLAFP